MARRRGRERRKSQYIKPNQKEINKAQLLCARLELDLIKSCVSKHKDRFVKSLRRFTYVLLCIYIYICIHIIFLLTYISNLRNFISHFTSPTLTLVLSRMVSIFHISFFTFSFFSTKFLRGGHANLRVSRDSFHSRSRFFSNPFVVFFFLILLSITF